MSLNDIAAKLGAAQVSVLNAVQMVEVGAAQAQAIGQQPLTSEQKLQAAVDMVSAVSPHAAAILGPLKVIISSVVSMFNLFGVFKRSSAPTASLPAAAQPAPVPVGAPIGIMQLSQANQGNAQADAPTLA